MSANYYGMYGRNGYGIMSSWDRVQRSERYLGGGGICKKFIMLSEAKKWARDSFQQNVCINGEHPRHGKLYFPDECDLNQLLFAKNLKLKKAVIHHDKD